MHLGSIHECFVFFLITVSGLGSPERVVKIYLWMQMQHFLGDAPGNRLFPLRFKKMRSQFINLNQTVTATRTGIFSLAHQHVLSLESDQLGHQTAINRLFSEPRFRAPVRWTKLQCVSLTLDLNSLPQPWPPRMEHSQYLGPCGEGDFSVLPEYLMHP